MWRLVSFVALPLDSSYPIVFLLSLYFYWFIGSTLEREWGTTKFTVFYAVGFLLTLASGFVLDLWGLGSVIDMFYVNMSLFFAFATLYPDLQVLFFFVIPVKVKWLAWLDLALYVIQWPAIWPAGCGSCACCPWRRWSTTCSSSGRTSWAASAGSSTGTTPRPSTSRRLPNRPSSRRATSTSAPSAARPTPTTPDEEFRYCSKCNGYYCYCSEHIHNHVHIQ